MSADLYGVRVLGLSAKELRVRFRVVVVDYNFDIDSVPITVRAGLRLRLRKELVFPNGLEGFGVKRF